MQVLVLAFNAQQYGLATRHVVQVLPAMALTPIAPAAGFIAGVMNYRGSPVPVIDLARVGGVLPAAAAANEGVEDSAGFDTRILLVDHVQPSGARHLLGLLAPHVTGIRQIDADRLTASGVVDPNAPFLGQVLADDTGLLQLIEPSHLVPPEVCAWLFDAVSG